MKHILAVLLTIACIFTLCACGASETQSTNTKDSVKPNESKASFSDGTEPHSLPVQKTQPKDLKLTDYGFYTEPSYTDDMVYMDYCGMVYNPNESQSAMFPEIIATISNPDGTIIATESQMGTEIMPLDTVAITGTMAVPTAQITNETTVEFQVKCSRFNSADQNQKPRSSDFEIKNLFEQSGSRNYITGTVTNLSDETVDSVYLTLLLRKEGKIVFIDESFVDDLKSGVATAFQFQNYLSWPAHDSIEVAVQVW